MPLTYIAVRTQFFRHTTMDLDFEKAILVIGGDYKYLKHVAKALAPLQPKPVSQTLGGIKIYARTLRHLGKAAVDNSTRSEINKTTKFGEIVVNTSPFQNLRIDDATIGHVATQWTRLNCSYGLNGKHVAVVCVIDATSLKLPDSHSKSGSRKTRSRYYKPTWLNMLRYIFDPSTTPITFIVKLPCEKDSTDAKKMIIKNLREKERFEKVVEVAIEVGEKVRVPKMKFFPYLSPQEPEDVRRHGPWGPVKVVLFGRTGSGKSTLAQMLTKGKLDPHAKVFAASSGARGKTEIVEHDENAKWYVVDTPGLGERADKGCTVTTSTALMRIYEDVEENHGIFTHFLYVCRQYRHDMLEADTWKLFVRLFGEQVASNFTVVITDSSPSWVETHMQTLREQFKGCDHFLSVQFPPVDPDDEELEEENQGVRVESLRQLEKSLAARDRKEVKGIYGHFSKMTLAYYQAHFTLVKRVKTTVVGKVGASMTKGVVKVGGVAGKTWKRTRKEIYAKRFQARLGGLNFGMAPGGCFPQGQVEDIAEREEQRQEERSPRRRRSYFGDAIERLQIFSKRRQVGVGAEESRGADEIYDAAEAESHEM